MLSFIAAYGGGTYIGAENVAEYYSIVFPKVNRDMWLRDGDYDVPTLPQVRFYCMLMSGEI